MKEADFRELVVAELRKALPTTVAVEPHYRLHYSLVIGPDGRPTIHPDEDSRKRRDVFQTDVCILERRGDATVPRVAFELKTRLHTHDAIVYAAKARRHKVVYPYLRYGFLVANLVDLPDRLLKHREGLDFCAALGSNVKSTARRVLPDLARRELEASRLLEDIATGARRVSWIRLVPQAAES